MSQFMAHQPSGESFVGIKTKKSKSKSEDETLSSMIYSSNLRDQTYVGIRNEFGEVRIQIPPVPGSCKYELFGYAVEDTIEDILQPKKRTRYVRGLDESSKKDRRREQNRNAAARSRARKNAMIAKVIQLHQENLGLRAFISDIIREQAGLEAEKADVEGVILSE